MMEKLIKSIYKTYKEKDYNLNKVHEEYKSKPIVKLTKSQPKLRYDGKYIKNITRSSKELINYNEELNWKTINYILNNRVSLNLKYKDEEVKNLINIYYHGIAKRLKINFKRNRKFLLKNKKQYQYNHKQNNNIILSSPYIKHTSLKTQILFFFLLTKSFPKSSKIYKTFSLQRQNRIELYKKRIGIENEKDYINKELSKLIKINDIKGTQIKEDLVKRLNNNIKYIYSILNSLKCKNISMEKKLIDRRIKHKNNKLNSYNNNVFYNIFKLSSKVKNKHILNPNYNNKLVINPYLKNKVDSNDNTKLETNLNSKLSTKLKTKSLNINKLYNDYIEYIINKNSNYLVLQYKKKDSKLNKHRITKKSVSNLHTHTIFKRLNILTKKVTDTNTTLLTNNKDITNNNNNKTTLNRKSNLNSKLGLNRNKFTQIREMSTSTLKRSTNKTLLKKINVNNNNHRSNTNTNINSYKNRVNTIGKNYNDINKTYNNNNKNSYTNKSNNSNNSNNKSIILNDDGGYNTVNMSILWNRLYFLSNRIHIEDLTKLVEIYKEYKLNSRSKINKKDLAYEGYNLKTSNSVKNMYLNKSQLKISKDISKEDDKKLLLTNDINHNPSNSSSSRVEIKLNELNSIKYLTDYLGIIYNNRKDLPQSRVYKINNNKNYKVNREYIEEKVTKVNINKLNERKVELIPIKLKNALYNVEILSNVIVKQLRRRKLQQIISMILSKFNIIELADLTPKYKEQITEGIINNYRNILYKVSSLSRIESNMKKNIYQINTSLQDYLYVSSLSNKNPLNKLSNVKNILNLVSNKHYLGLNLAANGRSLREQSPETTRLQVMYGSKKPLNNYSNHEPLLLGTNATNRSYANHTFNTKIGVTNIKLYLYTI